MPAQMPTTHVAALLVRQSGLLLLVLNAKRGAFNFPMTKMREVLAEENGLGLESGETAAGRVAVEVLGPRPFPRERLKAFKPMEKKAKSDVTGEIKRYVFHIFALELPVSEEVQSENPVVWFTPEQITQSEPLASIAGEVLKQADVVQWLANVRQKKS